MLRRNVVICCCCVDCEIGATRQGELGAKKGDVAGEKVAGGRFYKGMARENKGSHDALDSWGEKKRFRRKWVGLATCTVPWRASYGQFCVPKAQLDATPQCIQHALRWEISYFCHLVWPVLAQWCTRLERHGADMSRLSARNGGKKRRKKKSRPRARYRKMLGMSLSEQRRSLLAPGDDKLAADWIRRKICGDGIAPNFRSLLLFVSVSSRLIIMSGSRQTGQIASDASMFLAMGDVIIMLGSTHTDLLPPRRCAFGILHTPILSARPDRLRRACVWPWQVKRGCRTCRQSSSHRLGRIGLH